MNARINQMLEPLILLAIVAVFSASAASEMKLAIAPAADGPVAHYVVA